MGTQDRKIWLFDDVLAEARKYKSISEWSRESKGSYSAASKNKWLQHITPHLIRSIKPNGFWTKERVIEDAKRFSTRSEWRKQSSSAATMAQRNGWYEEATAHMQLLVEHDKWTKKAVLEEAKKYTTRSEWGRSKGGSYSAALKKGWVDEAARHMTSSDRTRIWTKERVIADAIKYSTRGEWHKASGNAAHVAISKGWMDEATIHMHRTHSFGETTIYRILTQLDISFEPQKRFEKIRSKKPLPFDFYLPDFRLVIEYQGSQHHSESNRKHNDSLVDIKRRDEIKRIGALENNLNYLAIDETSEKGIEAALIDELKKLSRINRVRCSFQKRRLSDSELALLKALGTYTKEQVLEDARQYQSYPEWRKASPLFQIATKNGWLQECKAHMLSEFDVRSKAKLLWTKEKAHELAKMHKSRSEFKAANSSAYTRARINGWLDEICSHMSLKIHPNGYWTKERVINSAKEFKTRTAWMRSVDSTAYDKAREQGWLAEACAHMEWKSTKPRPK